MDIYPYGKVGRNFRFVGRKTNVFEMVIAINIIVDISRPDLVNDGCYPIVSSFEDFEEFKQAVRSEGFCDFIESFCQKVGVPKHFVYLCCTLIDGDYFKEFKIKFN